MQCFEPKCVTRRPPPACTHHCPGSHPVCRRPTRMWSGRGAWRPGGARHCTYDLDARTRVRSACLGRWQAGWEPPHAHHNAPAPAYGAPAIPESERPRRRHRPDGRLSDQAGLVQPIKSLAIGARPAPRAGAGRRQERRPGAPAARRRLGGGSALDEVEKVLPRLWASVGLELAQHLTNSSAADVPATHPSGLLPLRPSPATHLARCFSPAATASCAKASDTGTATTAEAASTWKATRLKPKSS